MTCTSGASGVVEFRALAGSIHLELFHAVRGGGHDTRRVGRQALTARGGAARGIAL